MLRKIAARSFKLLAPSALALSLAATSASALTINDTFLSSITGNPNAAAIEAAIQSATNQVSALYTNPVTVNILFGASNSVIVQTNTAPLQISYTSYTNLLQANAAANPANTTLAAALAHLAAGNAGPAVQATSVHLRALGMATSGYFDSTGTFHAGGGQPFDAVISVNGQDATNQTFFRVLVQHGLVDVLGGGASGSAVGLSCGGCIAPLDPYRFQSTGSTYQDVVTTPSFTSSTSAVAAFSIDGGNTAITGFNQAGAGSAYGDFDEERCLIQSAFFCGTTELFIRGIPEDVMLESIGYDAVFGAHDFNNDGTSDILWKDTSGDLAMWLMSAGQFASGGALGDVGTSWSVAGTRDFNEDGYADILWLDNAGDLALWLMNGTSASSYSSLGNVGTQWMVAGTGDFNGDGTGDILWRNGTTDDVAIWLMSNGAYASGFDLGVMPSNWQIAGTGDFNGDGTIDILWRNTSNGSLAIWLMSGGQVSSSLNVGSVPTDWTVVGTGDFNGDGVSDILWRDSAGDLAIWLMNSSGQMASGAGFTGIPTTWSVAETGDFDGDGKSDILWIDQSGDLGVWLMNGTTISSSISLGNVGTSWSVQGVNAD